MATRETVAVPSILFGCDSILFSEAKIAELECIQARVDKMFLGVSKTLPISVLSLTLGSNLYVCYFAFSS